MKETITYRVQFHEEIRDSWIDRCVTDRLTLAQHQYKVGKHNHGELYWRIQRIRTITTLDIEGDFPPEGP